MENDFICAAVSGTARIDKLVHDGLAGFLKAL
jgi:hypothetical protein